MIAYIITIIILALICAYLAYRIWFLAGVLGDIQERDEDTFRYVEELEATNLYMYDRIKKSYESLQEIDRLGAFEAEDEAGTTFQLLKEVVTELKEEFDAEAQEK